MVKFLRTIIILLFFATAGYAQPSADSIAARAVDVLGAAAWPQARYFAFTLTVERDGKVISSFPQKWDRATGEYRVSGNDPQGRPFDVAMNLNTLTGHATIDGIQITSPGRLKDLGSRRFTNDIFWLLMPLRMTEHDVHRTYLGERNDSCGHVWDVLKLTFDKGGLLPGDTYWAWVNHDTGMVEEWDIQLQGTTDQRPTEVILHDYQRFGGLLISTRREIRGTGQTMKIENLQILPVPPKGAFQ